MGNSSFSWPLPQFKSGLPFYKNLVMAQASNTTVTITADLVLLLDSSNNSMVVSSLSDTVDITASGANGLDTGSEATSTWYHIWCIAKSDGTKECLLSASATAPTLPAGYTFKCYLGAVYNNSSGNFVEFYQRENKVVQTITKVLNGGTQTSLTSVNVAAVIPTTAKAVFGNLYQTAGGYWIYLSACNSLVGNLYTAGEHWMSAPYWLPMITAQTLWYKTDNAAVAVHIWISGWEY